MPRRNGLNKIPAVAKALDVSVPTIRAWVALRKIGYVKLGRAVRIPDEEIDRLKERGRVPALGERR